AHASATALSRSRARTREAAASGGGAPRALRKADRALESVLDQLRTLEDARRDGTLTLPDGQRLGVTNLAKPFWSKLKLTKGDLLRYYTSVSPYILPAVEDR